MLDKSSKIYVAGHNGLVGSAIWNNLKSRGYNNLIGRSHKELDLTDQYTVKKFFDEEKPDAGVEARPVWKPMHKQADVGWKKEEVRCKMAA